ncbi:MAG: UDP-N-acetylmuramoyl-tripeptide--D-alanyl-D-alanine ligase [Gammaproteobacteria bacterium]|nr:UDP-N-acetylmuramoyl-tripeptide--D-alanyl-D-alanine ligase [Gammaproteobacteria bacterium]
MLRLSEAAAALNAERSGADRVFSGVTTDSRAVKAGDLFVALKGERFDGHDFVGRVKDQGAAAALVERRDPSWGDFPLLTVADTRLALGALSGFWRRRFDIPVVGLTGSCGKTTVKEMIAAILSVQAGDEAVLATRGNLNNDIGMPLTLLELRDVHRYAVIEMGMNHPGEIAYLTGIARPDVALITNARAAHLAGFPHLNPLPQAGKPSPQPSPASGRGGDREERLFQLGANEKSACFDLVEQVARAKGEIFQGLVANGTAVINADDPHAALWLDLAASHRVIRFGLDPAAEVSGTFRLQPSASDIEMTTPEGRFSVALPLPGEHNVCNALAAAAVAMALGLDNAAIARGLATVAAIKGRLQKKSCLHGAALIDDTYNANPGSVRAAIAVLAGLPGKKILVLGDMGELGDAARALHAEIGAAAKAAGIDRMFTLGDLSAAAAEAFGQGGRHFEYIEDLLHEVENHLAPDVTVLVKGSRFMQMERVVKSFELREGQTCCSH